MHTLFTGRSSEPIEETYVYMRSTSLTLANSCSATVNEATHTHTALTVVISPFNLALAHQTESHLSHMYIPASLVRTATSGPNSPRPADVEAAILMV